MPHHSAVDVRSGHVTSRLFGCRVSVENRSNFISFHPQVDSVFDFFIIIFFFIEFSRSSAVRQGEGLKGAGEDSYAL